MIVTITGLSGSGKSRISNYLCDLDKRFIHLDIDKIGHHVLEMPDVIKRIRECFGISLIDDKIDRKSLSSIVFNDPKAMDLLTDITWNKMEEIIDKFILDNKDKIIILDWALIPKTKYFESSDMNILVRAPYEVRESRISLRDGIDKSKFRERNNAGMDYGCYLFDYIVDNNGKKLDEEVAKIYEKSIVSG